MENFARAHISETCRQIGQKAHKEVIYRIYKGQIMFRCQVACPGSMFCCQKAAVTAGETQKVLFRAIFCVCARSRFCHKAIASSHSTRQINHKESGDGGRERDKDTNRCVCVTSAVAAPAKGAETARRLIRYRFTGSTA